MMNSDVELFDKAVSEDGGRFDLSTRDETTARLFNDWAEWIRGCNQLSREGRFPRLPDVHIDWIANRRLNACAFSHEGRLFVGVHEGAPAIIETVANRLLADKRVLPHIGDPAKEIELPSVPDGIALDTRALVEGGVNQLPRCAKRRHYAGHIRNIAVKALFSHEM